jgi:ribosomal subunit interface protein
MAVRNTYLRHSDALVDSNRVCYHEFMKINIKTIKVDLTPSFKAYIEEKFGQLDKFLGHFESEGEVEVHVEVLRTTAHHQHGDVFRGVASVHLPGKELRAEEEAGDARSAVDMVKDTLRLEIEKYRDKFLTPKRGKDK